MLREWILAGACLVALAACNASGVAIPKTDADKLKVANQIAQLITDSKMLDTMTDAMSATVMPTVRNMCETVPANDRDACLARLEKARPAIERSTEESMEQVKALMPELMQEMGEIMARLYTGEELAKMLEYQTSPEAKSIMAKQSQLMGEYMPRVQARVQAVQLETMRRTQARVAAALKEPVPPDQPPI